MPEKNQEKHAKNSQKFIFRKKKKTCLRLKKITSAPHALKRGGRKSFARPILDDQNTCNLVKKCGHYEFVRDLLDWKAT